jgi:hypothetical protein
VPAAVNVARKVERVLDALTADAGTLSWERNRIRRAGARANIFKGTLETA